MITLVLAILLIFHQATGIWRGASVPVSVRGGGNEEPRILLNLMLPSLKRSSVYARAEGPLSELYSTVARMSLRADIPVDSLSCIVRDRLGRVIRKQHSVSEWREMAKSLTEMGFVDKCTLHFTSSDPLVQSEGQMLHIKHEPVSRSRTVVLSPQLQAHFKKLTKRRAGGVTVLAGRRQVRQSHPTTEKPQQRITLDDIKSSSRGDGTSEEVHVEVAFDLDHDAIFQHNSVNVEAFTGALSSALRLLSPLGLEPLGLAMHQSKHPWDVRSAELSFHAHRVFNHSSFNASTVFLSLFTGDASAAEESPSKKKKNHLPQTGFVVEAYTISHQAQQLIAAGAFTPSPHSKQKGQRGNQKEPLAEHDDDFTLHLKKPVRASGHESTKQVDCRLFAVPLAIRADDSAISSQFIHVFPSEQELAENTIIGQEVDKFVGKLLRKLQLKNPRVDADSWQRLHDVHLLAYLQKHVLSGRTFQQLLLDLQGNGRVLSQSVRFELEAFSSNTDEDEL